MYCSTFVFDHVVDKNLISFDQDRQNTSLYSKFRWRQQRRRGHFSQSQPQPQGEEDHMSILRHMDMDEDYDN